MSCGLNGGLDIPEIRAWSTARTVALEPRYQYAAGFPERREQHGQGKGTTEDPQVHAPRRTVSRLSRRRRGARA